MKSTYRNRILIAAVFPIFNFLIVSRKVYCALRVQIFWTCKCSAFCASRKRPIGKQTCWSMLIYIVHESRHLKTVGLWSFLENWNNKGHVSSDEQVKWVYLELSRDKNDLLRWILSWLQCSFANTHFVLLHYCIIYIHTTQHN